MNDAEMKNYKFIGGGTEGSVYKLNSSRCIKLYKSNKSCKKEVESLIMATGDRHFPMLYEYGDKYLIREYIDGISLDEYLLTSTLSPNMMLKLIELYDAMKKVGFSRLDTAIFHIFVSRNGDIKLIDTSKAMKIKTETPALLLSSLEDLGQCKALLNFVKNIRPDLYDKWKTYVKIKVKKYS